jgi:hypothetical protein
VRSRSPVELVLDLPVATDPGGRDGRFGVAVAGDQVADLDGAGELDPDDASAALIVRRVRRPWPVLTVETAGMRAQGSFSCR